MSSAERYVPHYTVDDYQRWEGDWELWGGHAVSMVPSPFGSHSKVTGRVVTAITNAIDASDCRANVLPEIDWVVSQDTVVRPDVVVVCGDPPERHVVSAPAVVVEVLSESTRERDLGPKQTIYQEQKVPYYLILDPDAGVLTALELGKNGSYAEVRVSDSLILKICGDCELDVDVRRLFG